MLYVWLPPAASVANDQVYGAAIAVPLLSLPFTVAVYVLPAASAAPGVKVTVFVVALYAVLPVTGVLPLASVKVTEAAVIVVENTALGATVVATPVALAAGVVEVTCGRATD